MGQTFEIDSLDEMCAMMCDNIEPKRVVAEWVPCKASIHPYGNDVKCSACGYRMGSSFGLDTCTKCRARMETD